MSRKARVPGMAGPSFAIPVCSVHGIRCQKNDQGEWVCIECFDNWMQGQFLGKSIGGVELPDRVRDERRPSVKDVMVNRRWRRHAK